MTSHYQQQLVQQLRAAEDELGRWRRQGRRADRYRAAWQNARRRARQQHSIVERYRADHLAQLMIAEGIRAARGLADIHQQRAEQAEARIAALTPYIDRVLAATGRMVEHWADANSTGNTAWRNEMWAELHQAADVLAATLAGEPSPLNVPDGACGAYKAAYGAVCTRPSGHPEAYHRDASERTYWLDEHALTAASALAAGVAAAPDLTPIRQAMGLQARP